MIADLLLSLNGLLTAAAPSSKDALNRWRTVEEIFHPSEQQIINYMLEQLGRPCQRLHEFCLKHQQQQQSLNLISLSNGIREIICQYRKKLADIEQSLLDPTTGDMESHRQLTPISFFYHNLSDFRIILPALVDLIEKLDFGRRPDVNGCFLIDSLYESCQTGVDILRSTFTRLTCHCIRTVLHRQTALFILYGECHDPFNEFYITKSVSDNEKVPRFKFEVSKLPKFIPVRVAECVEFMVFAVRTIHETDSHWRYDATTIDRLSKFVEIEKDECLDLDKILIDFENELVVIHSIVHNKLWKVIVGTCGLRKHLETFRDIYLLGSGDFFEAFMDELDRVSFQMTDFELNYLLNKASGNAKNDNYHLIDRFVFKVDPTNHMAKDAIGLPVSLNYCFNESEKPLSWLISESDFKSMNQMFFFMLRVKCAQRRLERSWKYTQTSPVLSILRFKMLHFIHSLQYYQQSDGVDCLFTILLEKLDNATRTNDFSQLSEEFFRQTVIDPLSTRSMLKSSSLLEALQKSIGLCFELCQTMERLASVQDLHALDERVLMDHKQLSTKWREQTGFLQRSLRAVASMTGSAASMSPYLQLLLRLDIKSA